MENWRDIPDLDGRFQVSDTGKVRNAKTGAERKPYINEHGYCIVGFYNKEKGFTTQYRVHRLVADAFIPNPEGKRTVNHLDGNKQNNSVENLEWATHKENVIHANNIGLRVTSELQRKTASENMKKNRLHAKPERRCYLVDVIGHRMEFPSIKAAACYVDGFPGAIVRCCQGKKKSYKGFRWGYCDADTFKG